jgi:hypothetical protein
MLTFTKISGNGFRPSLFGTSVDDHRIFYLGQTAYDWYTRAQAAVARFDGLLARAKGIPVASERDPILAWIGPAGSSDTPMERYLTVVEDIRFTSEGENMDKYGVARLQNRVVKLENYNTELEAKVRVAELATGTTPPAGTTTPAGTRTTIAPVAAKTDWTLPLLIGGGAIAIAVVITLVAKKK